MHVCDVDSDWERQHLIFRDYLRAHLDARQQYVEAKQASAASWPDDGLAYTDAKTKVILEILHRAELEAHYHAAVLSDPAE